MLRALPQGLPLFGRGRQSGVGEVELYEQLKKDVSEESARMLAEVVPPVGDLATKTDLAGLELAIEQRISRLERRVFGLFLSLLVPVWGALVAAGVKFVIQL